MLSLLFTLSGKFFGFSRNSLKTLELTVELGRLGAFSKLPEPFRELGVDLVPDLNWLVDFGSWSLFRLSLARLVTMKGFLFSTKNSTDSLGEPFSNLTSMIFSTGVGQVFSVDVSTEL